MSKALKHLVFLLIALSAILLPGAAIRTGAQGLPEAFGDALTDLGKRLGLPLTLRDFDVEGASWLWKPTIWKDKALECPKPGQAVVVADTPGYQFLFVLKGVSYDYRVSFFDRKSLILCSHGVGTTAGLAAVQGPGCTLAPRLVVGKQGIVLPGDPNNLRSDANMSAALLGQIPGGASFSVLGGPVCRNGMNWWKVNFAGTIGWTAEGALDTYWLAPS